MYAGIAAGAAAFVVVLGLLLMLVGRDDTAVVDQREAARVDRSEAVRVDRRGWVQPEKPPLPRAGEGRGEGKSAVSAQLAPGESPEANMTALH